MMQGDPLQDNSRLACYGAVTQPLEGCQHTWYQKQFLCCCVHPGMFFMHTGKWETAILENECIFKPSRHCIWIAEEMCKQPSAYVKMTLKEGSCLAFVLELRRNDIPECRQSLLLVRDSWEPDLSPDHKYCVIHFHGFCCDQHCGL